MQAIEMNLGGRSLRIETGRLAAQASGSVMVYYGDTMVLCNCVSAEKPREGIDFFPLMVDYEEKLYAAGKIPGSWFRKEGRPTDKCILTSRLIDRPFRPLFPQHWRNDVQVIASVMSADQENDPDIPALIGCSAALVISDIPFAGPVGAVRVGIVNGEFVINPTIQERAQSKLDLVVAGTKDAVTMLEAGAAEVAEPDMVAAIQFAHGAIRQICQLQEELRKTCGKPKIEVPPPIFDKALEEIARRRFTAQIKEAVQIVDRKERSLALDAINAEAVLQAAGNHPERERLAALLQDEKNKELDGVKDLIVEEQLCELIVREKKRPDGRRLDQIRPLSAVAGFLKRTHGSALFTRGQTQIVAAATLGAPSEKQTLDGLLPEETKSFMLHYYFPPYGVGEVKPMRGPGRREIGHGALAERALSRLLPKQEEFPYTIRVVCEAVESNGSTSMGSVCSGSLALFDAGVPMRKAVGGIAMGLFHHGSDYAVLTDIQGLEDRMGEMDFKVAGTRDGITALQLDIKLTGVEIRILEQALYQAKTAREEILGVMNAALADPRPELSKYAPRIITLQINPDKIKDVIGPGGKMIHKIIELTGVKIDVEDDGRIFIATPDAAAAEEAKRMIEEITAEVEVGKVYQGKVTRLMGFGAFVEVLPGKEGLVHISQIGPGRVERVEDALSVGDEVTVKVIEIDQMGRVNLTRKGVGGIEEDAEGGTHPAGARRRGRPPYQDRGRHRDGDRRRSSHGSGRRPVHNR